MARRHLRTALAALTLTVTLAATPPLAAADGGHRTTNLAEAVWQWVVALWAGGGETSDIGPQSDPNGSTTPPAGEESDISLQIDPNGSTTSPAGGTSDLGPYIDPDG